MRFPMPEEIGGELGVLRVDEIDRLVGAVPSSEEVGAWEDSPGSLTSFGMVGRVVQDDIALFGKAIQTIR